MQHELLGLMQDEYGRRWVKMMMDLPAAVHVPLYRYMMLFKPPQQGLRWSTLYTRTADIVPMIQERRVERRNQVFVIPLELWVDTLTELVESPPQSLRLPLKGHGYLLEMLASRAEQAAAKTEQKREDDRRQRPAEEPRQGPAAREQNFQPLKDALRDGLAGLTNDK